MGSTAKAQQRIDRAFQLLGDTHAYPADKIEPMSDAYHALQAQADHYSETGQTQKAIDMYQQLLEKLVAWGSKPDDDLRDATCISRTWTALASLLRRVGRTDEAVRLEAQRTELWNHWQSKLPNAPSLLRQSLSQITPHTTLHAVSNH
jgi:tetratricopeptide (TPR) repeat protein